MDTKAEIAVRPYAVTTVQFNKNWSGLFGSIVMFYPKGSRVKIGPESGQLPRSKAASLINSGTLSAVSPSGEVQE